MCVLKISAVLADICGLSADAIVNPANSSGTMGGGVALAIRKKGGKVIEDEAVALAPIRVGEAVLTGAGKLPCRFVVHAPTMVRPVEKVGVGNVRLAVRAALSVAKENGLKNRIPGDRHWRRRGG